MTAYSCARGLRNQARIKAPLRNSATAINQNATTDAYILIGRPPLLDLAPPLRIGTIRPGARIEAFNATLCGDTADRFRRYG